MKSLKITQQITNRTESDSLPKYFNELQTLSKPISSEEELKFVAMIKSNDEIQKRNGINALTTANLRFVVSVAKQYQGQISKNSAVQFVDLISAGNFGLVKAASKFDEKVGVKFISYAVWWIRQSIMETIQRENTIVSLPSNRFAQLQNYKKIVRQLVQELEREPNEEEIIDGIKRILKDRWNKVFDRLDVERIKDYHRMSLDSSSLDQFVGEEESTRAIDMIESESLAEFNNKFTKKEKNSKIIVALEKHLKPIEKDILLMYYGIGFVESMSLEEISNKFDLSKERVRQLKNSAEAKLKKVKNIKNELAFA